VNQDEEKLLRSVALQNAQAVLLARERAERALLAANEALERRSSELAEQREFFRVTLASIGDAVLTTDTEARITFLNPVAETMTGWKLEDAVGQPLEKVFNIINVQSREPAQNPVTRVLREGVVVGLANHPALIALDGRETPIDDSAAPIRSASGNISGVVMVFHDVTKQRQAEFQLRASNQELSEVRDNLEKRVQERTAELAAANEDLRQLSARLLYVQDEERRRLARELHDSIGQLLAATSLTRGGLGRFQRMLNWSNKYRGKFALFRTFCILRFLKLQDSHRRCVGTSMDFRNAVRLRSTLKFLKILNGCQTKLNSPFFA
jgi:PAS domain S-box-containing protein